jgi:hypothetical protein
MKNLSESFNLAICLLGKIFLLGKFVILRKILFGQFWLLEHFCPSLNISPTI